MLCLTKDGLWSGETHVASRKQSRFLQLKNVSWEQISQKIKTKTTI